MNELTEAINVIALLGDLGTVAILVGAIYLGLTGRVVSRFQYDEMKRSYQVQIDYWKRKCRITDES